VEVDIYEEGFFTGKIFIGRIFTENNECRSLVSVNYNGE